MSPNITCTNGYLNTKNIVSDPAYQRSINPGRVKQIAEHFNPLKVEPLKVSYRDGKYYIFDGQHTMRMLILRNGGEDLVVECRIYNGMTQRDEAELFAIQNDFEKAPDKNEKMKALLTAGDIEIVELKKAVEDAGFIFDFSKGQGYNKIICCGQVYKIFKKARAADFAAFLGIIKQSWDGIPDSLRKEIIGGMWIFYSTYKYELNANLAIKKFSKTNPIEIYRDGKVYKNYPGDSKYAYMLTMIYNKGQRTGRLDINKLQ